MEHPKQRPKEAWMQIRHRLASLFDPTHSKSVFRIEQSEQTVNTLFKHFSVYFVCLVRFNNEIVTFHYTQIKHYNIVIVFHTPSTINQCHITPVDWTAGHFVLLGVGVSTKTITMTIQEDISNERHYFLQTAHQKRIITPHC